MIEPSITRTMAWTLRVLTERKCRSSSEGWRKFGRRVSLWLCLVLATSALKAQDSPQAQPPTQDWITLPAEKALKGFPVKFEGTVLCYDADWGQLYVHDGVKTIYLTPPSFTNRFEVGQRVAISGKTSWDETGSIITNAIALIEGRKPLPQATPLKLADLFKASGEWVEVVGEVRVAEASHERVDIILKNGAQKCQVYVMQTSSADPFKDLADCVVKIRGINASRTHDGQLDSANLFCPGLDQITIVTPSPLDRWHLPVTAIDSLLTRPLGSWTNQPVHINGLVDASQPGQMIAIKDPTGVLSAEVVQVNAVARSERVELWGFLTVQSNRTLLTDAYFEPMDKSSGDLPMTGLAKEKSTNQMTLTTIKQVRSLSRMQANRNLPARVRGVLTFVDTDWGLAFLQDDHDAIFLATAQSGLRPGQYVEASGLTDGGGFAPELINCTTVILGATNYPNPAKVDLQEAVTGKLDSRWVETDGVVRQATKSNGRISLSLMGPEGRFTATVLDFNTNRAPIELIDSLVRIRGACGSTVNTRGQLSAIALNVPSLGEITVIDPSPSDPFSVEAIPISDVAAFSAHRLAGRRIKASGIVTMTTPGQDLFLQDASGGIRIGLGSPTNDFHVGERLSVLGFPALLAFPPRLEEAAIRREGLGNLPKAKATTAAHILRDGTDDGMRVELEAQVLQNYAKSAQARLLLQDGPIIFTAQVAQSVGEKSVLGLSGGSIVKLRGVCVIQGTENNEPGSFRLLVASPKDLILVKTAPWWTTSRVIFVLGGMTIAAVLATFWVLLLRRVVRQQTQIIRQNQKDLIEASRLAGMAEVATNVLHNVGNVLNSVNISASVASDKIKSSQARDGLSRAVSLLEEHDQDLGDFVTKHPRGKHLPTFLKLLSDQLQAENQVEMEELGSLRKNIGHIEEIVATQLTLAKAGGTVEIVTIKEMFEDALLIGAHNLERYGIEVKRHYGAAAGKIAVDKHKLLQILVNLITNARNACKESNQPHKVITLRVERNDGMVRMSVGDNGVGIAPENVLRIFNHGFTTRKDGHGFGLHGGALAAKQLGGQLTVHSSGPGCGARFTLELPLHRNHAVESGAVAQNQAC